MMQSGRDLSNQRFGRWVVLGFGRFKVDACGRYRPFWECRCDCGKERLVSGQSLTRGVSNSCGCVQRRVRSHGFCQGGHAGTNATYKIWNGMKARCQSSKNKAYRFYGGRGITVCERWQKFENFYADMGERPTGLSIERIDNNKGYSPENCCWATMEDQWKNKRKASTTQLTPAQVQCVRMLRGQKTAIAIAAIYEVSKTAVYGVLTRRTWNDLPEVYAPVT